MLNQDELDHLRKNLEDRLIKKKKELPPHSVYDFLDRFYEKSRASICKSTMKESIDVSNDLLKYLSSEFKLEYKKLDLKEIFGHKII